MLKYLFTAEFNDGTTVEQTQEDISFTGKGSAFTDVLVKDGLKSFSLHGKDNSVTVDLKTGKFGVNGLWVDIHDQYFDPSQHKLRLIYFRETIVERVQSDETTEDRHYVNRYFIGWHTTVKGKNIKVTLAVS